MTLSISDCMDVELDQSNDRQIDHAPIVAYIGTFLDDRSNRNFHCVSWGVNEALNAHVSKTEYDTILHNPLCQLVLTKNGFARLRDLHLSLRYPAVWSYVRQSWMFSMQTLFVFAYDVGCCIHLPANFRFCNLTEVALVSTPAIQLFSKHIGCFSRLRAVNLCFGMIEHHYFFDFLALAVQLEELVVDCICNWSLIGHVPRFHFADLSRLVISVNLINTQAHVLCKLIACCSPKSLHLIITGFCTMIEERALRIFLQPEVVLAVGKLEFNFCPQLWDLLWIHQHSLVLEYGNFVCEETVLVVHIQDVSVLGRVLSTIAEDNALFDAIHVVVKTFHPLVRENMFNSFALNFPLETYRFTAKLYVCYDLIFHQSVPEVEVCMFLTFLVTSWKGISRQLSLGLNNIRSMSMRCGLLHNRVERYTYMETKLRDFSLCPNEDLYPIIVYGKRS